jgi:hypothetical protein
MLASMEGAELAELGVRDQLRAPSVRPVRAVADLSVLVRSSSEDAAREQVERQIGDGEKHARVSLARWAELWLARITGLSEPKSMALQGLAASSPVGLFVPA